MLKDYFLNKYSGGEIETIKREGIHTIPDRYGKFEEDIPMLYLENKHEIWSLINDQAKKEYCECFSCCQHGGRRSGISVLDMFKNHGIDTDSEEKFQRSLVLFVVDKDLIWEGE